MSSLPLQPQHRFFELHLWKAIRCIFVFYIPRSFYSPFVNFGTELVPAPVQNRLFSKGIFLFFVFIATNQCRLPLTSVCKKSPHCGDLRDFTGCSEPVFNLQTFFASIKALPCRYLLQAPSFSLRPKSGQIRSKLPFPATVPPALQSGTQGQTGRKKRRTFWLAYSFNTSIIFANMRFYFCLYYIYC